MGGVLSATQARWRIRPGKLPKLRFLRHHLDLLDYMAVVQLFSNCKLASIDNLNRTQVAKAAMNFNQYSKRFSQLQIIRQLGFPFAHQY